MSKNLNISAQKVTQEIFDILDVRPSGAQGDKVAHAIEHVIINPYRLSAARTTEKNYDVSNSIRLRCLQPGHRVE